MNVDFEVLDVLARLVAIHQRDRGRPALEVACLCGWEATPSARSGRRQYAHVAEEMRLGLRDHGLLPIGETSREYALVTAEDHELLYCGNEDQARTEYAADPHGARLMTRTIRTYQPTTTPWEETE